VSQSGPRPVHRISLAAAGNLPHMEPMESTTENTAKLATARPPEGPAKRRRWPVKAHHRTRPQLLSRAELDGRTNAAREFDRLVASIEADLGGHDRLSAIEVALVEAFAGAAVTLNHLNTQLALGQPIDLGQHAQCVSAMVRVASRLGIARRAKDVGATLGDLLRADQRQEGAHG
jgi:hypothetical protein